MDPEDKDLMVKENMTSMLGMQEIAGQGVLRIVEKVPNANLS